MKKSKTTQAILKLRQANNDKIIASELERRGHSGNHECLLARYAEEDARKLLVEEVEQQPISALGEAIPAISDGDTAARMLTVNTLENPFTANLEASNDRIDLLIGNSLNVAAMALDASESIQANNSLEKMLAHQLALCHKTSFKLIDQALSMTSPKESQEQVRKMNCALRFMDTYQRGLLTIQKLRTGGNQTMTVQHVHVEAGGQAVIGSVQGGVAKEGCDKS